MAQSPNETKKRFELAPNEKFKICPFNPSHRVPNEAFMLHIIACEGKYNKERHKAGLSNNMAHCRYNYAHVWPRDQIIIHEGLCGDKSRLEQNDMTPLEPVPSASSVPSAKKSTKTRTYGWTPQEGDIIVRTSPWPVGTTGGKKKQVEQPKTFSDGKESLKKTQEVAEAEPDKETVAVPRDPIPGMSSVSMWSPTRKAPSRFHHKATKQVRLRRKKRRPETKPGDEADEEESE